MVRNSSIGYRSVRKACLISEDDHWLVKSRTITGDDSFASNTELSSYVNECFWPRLLSSTIRLAYALRDTGHTPKNAERYWTLEVILMSKRERRVRHRHFSSVLVAIPRCWLLPQYSDQKSVPRLDRLFTKLIFFILAPYNSILLCTQTAAKFYSKIADYFHSELRSAFELTHLFENYALTLTGRPKCADRSVHIDLI